MFRAWLLMAVAVGLVVAFAEPGEAAKKPQQKPSTAAPAPHAADPGPAKSLGGAGGWTAYVAESKTGKVCYLVGHPEKTQPAGMKRKTIMAMVTHRAPDSVSNVVSFDEGYALNEENDVIVEIGPEKFPLFAKDDTAWARTAELDRSIVNALVKERQAVVKGFPKKGSPTTDTYVLTGFSKALALIDKACDVKR